jgi:hypothetical protein
MKISILPIVHHYRRSSLLERNYECLSRLLLCQFQVDPETFAWFQAQGETAQQQMSVALRIYADAHKTYPAFVAKPA